MNTRHWDQIVFTDTFQGLFKQQMNGFYYTVWVIKFRYWRLSLASSPMICPLIIITLVRIKVERFILCNSGMDVVVS